MVDVTSTPSARPLRTIVIGAGMAGILAGIKLQAAGREFIIYEKADRIGGTWRENTYPGLTCDVPSHAYTYSFEPNPDWSRHLPPGAEIQDYFQGVVDKYQLEQHIRFNEEVVQCEYHNGRWALKMASGHTDTADVATGHRSEEHTSELQSRGHLVCRLLLEKKKDGSTEELLCGARQ